MAAKNAPTTTIAAATAAGAPSTDSTGAAISTVPTGTGETVTLRDSDLNTVEDPKTANGDAIRKEAGISASATAEQVLSNGGVDTTDHTLAQTSRPDVPAEPSAEVVKATAKGKPVDARVLVEVKIAGVRYLPNDVIEGLPTSLAEQHGDSVDTHPDAVEYARSQGFPVKVYAED